MFPTTYQCLYTRIFKEHLDPVYSNLVPNIWRCVCVCTTRKIDHSMDTNKK